MVTRRQAEEEEEKEEEDERMEGVPTPLEERADSTSEASSKNVEIDEESKNSTFTAFPQDISGAEEVAAVVETRGSLSPER